MPSFLVAILWWLAAYFLIGAAIYVVDRRWGVPLVRWLYNQWHKNKWDERVEKGFFYDRSRKRLKIAAGILTSSHFVLLFYTLHYDVFLALVLLVFDYFALLMGYRYFGLFVYRQIMRIEEVDDVLDVAARKVGEAREHGTAMAQGPVRQILTDAILWLPRAVKNVVYPDSPDAPKKPGG